MNAEKKVASEAASAHQLTFHIVDSAMGTGKSENLLYRARFNGTSFYIRCPEAVERYLLEEDLRDLEELRERRNVLQSTIHYDKIIMD